MITGEMLYKMEVLERQGLSTIGVEEISLRIYKECGGWIRIPHWFDWSWNTIQEDQDGRTNGYGNHPVKYRGKFPKRVAQFLCAIDYKPSDGFVEEIGNLYKQYEVNGTFEYDFTNIIDWQDGDFGDEGSCFWGDRYEAIEYMTNYGVIAIRLYEDGEGIGRAWIFDYGDHLVIFNGYIDSYSKFPSASHGDTNLFANLLCEIFNCSKKKVHLYNESGAEGLIYINNASGYFIAESEVLKALPDVHDLEIETYEHVRCDGCGERFPECEIYRLCDGDFCRGCYDDLVECEECGCVFLQSAAGFVGENHTLCDDCVIEHDEVEECCRCHVVEEVEYMTRLRNGELYCSHCAELHTFQCARCLAFVDNAHKMCIPHINICTFCNQFPLFIPEHTPVISVVNA